MGAFIIQSILWTLCAGALWISYWNYSRYVKAKRNKELSKGWSEIAGNFPAIEQPTHQKTTYVET